MDGEEFVDAVLDNEQVWSSDVNRMKLYKLSWKCPDPHHDMLMQNRYKYLEERHEVRHPEWFRESDRLS